VENREIDPEKELSTPLIRVRKLQETLHAKAKESPELRFHFLYDKVWRADVLAYAYARCESNQGAAGVDGQTFSDIGKYGLERWLGELAQELKAKTYQPQAVRRVWIRG
jgi:retron-type reverse transcriptase